MYNHGIHGSGSATSSSGNGKPFEIAAGLRKNRMFSSSFYVCLAARMAAVKRARIRADPADLSAEWAIFRLTGGAESVWELP